MYLTKGSSWTEPLRRFCFFEVGCHPVQLRNHVLVVTSCRQLMSVCNPNLSNDESFNYISFGLSTPLCVLRPFPCGHTYPVSITSPRSSLTRCAGRILVRMSTRIFLDSQYCTFIIFFFSKPLTKLYRTSMCFARPACPRPWSERWLLGCPRVKFNLAEFLRQ